MASLQRETPIDLREMSAFEAWALDIGLIRIRNL